MLQHHLPLHVVLIVFLDSQQQLLSRGRATLRRDPLALGVGVGVRPECLMSEGVLLEHRVEYGHVLLDGGCCYKSC